MLGDGSVRKQQVSAGDGGKWLNEAARFRTRAGTWEWVVRVVRRWICKLRARNCFVSWAQTMGLRTVKVFRVSGFDMRTTSETHMRALNPELWFLVALVYSLRTATSLRQEIQCSSLKPQATLPPLASEAQSDARELLVCRYLPVWF